MTPSDKPAGNGKKTPDGISYRDKMPTSILKLSTQDRRGNRELHEDSGVKHIPTKPGHHIGIQDLIKNSAIYNKPKMTIDPAMTTPSDKTAGNGKKMPDNKSYLEKTSASILEMNTHD